MIIIIHLLVGEGTCFTQMSTSLWRYKKTQRIIIISKVYPLGQRMST